MQVTRLPFWAGWVVLAGLGCAHDVHVRLPNEAGLPTGTLTVLLTQPAEDLTVAVNGQLVANRRHSGKVVVRNVASGQVRVDIAAGAGPARVERHVEVWLETDGHVVIPIPSSQASAGSMLETGLLSLAAAILARVIILAIL